MDFFHNGFSLIDEEGRDITPRKRVTRSINYFSRDKYLKYKYLKYILKNFHPDMYNSCTAISKRLALDCISVLECAGINVEIYWFPCALEKARVITVTNDLLVLYRIHNDSALKTMITHSDKGTELMLAYINSYRELMTYFTKTSFKFA
ncbi:hypothetical protein GWK48_11055 [Metallosphaera tengchongensis]|uniref:Uncharacterized protein n=1 Tax=Metallosphaera tengchongensis TaxID=1532350 RepID=A0A6N0P0P4_9CREN|nr:hypothetical protein [Metallosphaera tengchongensis]QKR00850.1 hypothetical protein GWK48_11055 [Metallosphaera tengchongensis]